MEAAIRDAYLETHILTATPQRLRLMLIDEALRRVRAAHAAFEGGQAESGRDMLGGCREVLSELVAGIEPDRSELAKRVLGLYLFLYSTLVEVQFGGDAGRLADMLRVLEEERVTWQAMCEQMPQRPAATAVAEEVAPQVVGERWNGGYAPRGATTAFSIEA
jgi:flagellar biosynthetic protein FliS